MPKTSGKGRTEETRRRLEMYRQKPQRDKKGRVIGGFLASRKTKEVNARIAPNRRWFGNTRVVNQDKLETFRREMEQQLKDPYKVMLNKKKLPLSLINAGIDSDGTQKVASNVLSMEPFEKTFGPRSKRKRANIEIDEYAEMRLSSEGKAEDYDEKADKDHTKLTDWIQDRPDRTNVSVYDRGASHRIWGEVYKVIDSSDVVALVLDARDPLGTRSARVERHLKEDCSHKHVFFIYNKVDLVPKWVAKSWIRRLSREYPTLAFHASEGKSYGKSALFNILRQYAALHKDKKQISVGLLGYPNVGKSSIINTMRQKKVCKVAPIPGETKVWQYITLMRRIFLIDCPGVVCPAETETDIELILKGVVRVTNVPDPVSVIPTILSRVKREYLAAAYNLTEDETSDSARAEDFLDIIARKMGKLLKGGEPDYDTVSRMVIRDWQTGKLPFYVAPEEEGESDEEEKEDDASSEADINLEAGEAASDVNEADEKEKEDEDESTKSNISSDREKVSFEEREEEPDRMSQILEHKHVKAARKQERTKKRKKKLKYLAKIRKR